jgi:hypothetical protein
VSAARGGLPAQVRTALGDFIQDVLDHPANRARWRRLSRAGRASLPADLWREAVLVVYRLLFVLRAEAAGVLPFMAETWWRSTYSPAGALAELSRAVLARGRAPLEEGLRELFAVLERGCRAGGLHVPALGGLFRREETPLLEAWRWGDRSCGRLLDRLLWLPAEGTAEGLPYAELRPEELGEVYEHLLGFEPGLATAAMARLRRGNLEVVVPAEQARPYGQAAAGTAGKTRVVWVEEIVPVAPSPARFYLRAAPGRKTSGSYYTPPDLVRFLVDETLRPQVEALSPADDPRPRDLLTLTVLDPAMGCGHFLVAACRFLGDHLLEACRACAARGLWDRVPGEIAPRLRANGGRASAAALGLCKQLVAGRCLYGVDRDAVAVELARACVWLEVGSETLSWALLEHRLVHGDSLTGPFSTDLPHPRRPPTAAPPTPLEQQFLGQLAAALDRARCGKEDALGPFWVLALAWAGAVMLWEEAGVTAAYRDLLAHVAAQGTLPDRLSPAVLRLIRRGAGLEALPPERDGLVAALGRRPLRGNAGGPLPFDLTFPEVFFPNGPAPGRQGFHAVLCNPPWEAIRPAEKEFFAAHDLTVLDAPTARERRGRIEELTRRPRVGGGWAAYRTRFEGQKACHDRLYRHQKVLVGNDLAGRYSDSYRVFAERAADLLRPGGYVGLLLPAAFHANEGATGVRRLYLEGMTLKGCYSFENRRRLFPIDSRCKFALVVAARGGPTDEFPCAFYLHDPVSLLRPREHLRYSLDFVRRTGGEYLTFVEARGRGELAVLDRMLAGGRALHRLEETHGLVFRTEPYAFNITTHGRLFTPQRTAGVLPGHLLLQEGKCFHQFTDRWGPPPRYAIPTDAAGGRPAALPNARFYRLAFRTIANATNERTAIGAVLPPGILVANSVAVEAAPERRANGVALWACAALNSFAFDLTVRLKGGANMNLFIMRTGLIPAAVPEAFLAHAALRLVCNHAGFAPLWREQLGGAWREPGREPFLWPVLETDAERWQVRAAVDAVVACAYGLSRREYACLLGTFRHKTQPRAAEWCLEKFDELRRVGEEAFARRHDPYWDIPLNPALPAAQPLA